MTIAVTLTLVVAAQGGETLVGIGTVPTTSIDLSLVDAKRDSYFLGRVGSNDTHWTGS